MKKIRVYLKLSLYKAYPFVELLLELLDIVETCVPSLAHNSRKLKTRGSYTKHLQHEGGEGATTRVVVMPSMQHGRSCGLGEEGLMNTQLVYKHMLCNEALNNMFWPVVTIVSSPNPPSR